MLSGKINIAGQDLETRDGLGIWDTESLDITATENSEVLLMEVPMNI